MTVQIQNPKLVEVIDARAKKEGRGIGAITEDLIMKGLEAERNQRRTGT